MAKVGAPVGNNNAGKNHVWRGALNRALSQYQGNGIPRGQALNLIAERVVKQALQGDKDSIAEIANRLDGKPSQAVSVAQDSAITIVHRIE